MWSLPFLLLSSEMTSMCEECFPLKGKPSLANAIRHHHLGCAKKLFDDGLMLDDEESLRAIGQEATAAFLNQVANAGCWIGAQFVYPANPANEIVARVDLSNANKLELFEVLRSQMGLNLSGVGTHDGVARTPISLATLRKDYNLVEAMLNEAQGINVDIQGVAQQCLVKTCYPLFAAYEVDDMRMMRKLVKELNADVKGPAVSFILQMVIPRLGHIQQFHMLRLLKEEFGLDLSRYHLLPTTLPVQSRFCAHLFDDRRVHRRYVPLDIRTLGDLLIGLTDVVCP